MTQGIYTVALRAEGSPTPDTWPVTQDLSSVLGVAAAATTVSAAPEQFDVSFSTILYGFLAGPGACCQFFQSYAGEAGLNRRALLARKHLTEEQLHALAGTPPLDPATPLQYTRSAKTLLTNAKALRDEVSSAPTPSPIDVRHLMGAYIYRPAGHGDELHTLGLSRVKWSAAFREWIGRAHPDERAGWDAIDRATFQTVSNEAAPAPPSGGGPPGATRAAAIISERFTFDSDAVLEKIPLDRDRMNMRPDVERFARLLAARDIKPPIALGLFGRWGSGKSFFMGMLRTRIDELTSAGGGDGYVANAVQITFNAWHYQDTNLWASIALRIFEGIALKLSGGAVSQPQEQRRELHRKLNSSRQLRADAETRRNEAVARRANVAAALAANTEARAQQQHRLMLRRLANVWTRLLREDTTFEADVKGLKRDAAQLGLDPAVKGIEDVQALQAKLKAFDRPSQALVAAALASFRSVRAAVWSLLAIAAVIAVVLAVDWFGRRYLTPFGSAFLQVSATLGAAATWAINRLQIVTRVAERAQRLSGIVVDAWKVPDGSEADQALVKQLTALDAAIQQQTEEMAAAERRAADAEAEIQRIDEGGLVYDFLRERRASDRYMGQLGLISTIRQDFETLRTLLEDLRSEGKKPIDRIILYVDDLDRCQPAQVVQVLQAVHLLLAFDIFNVVVGVDGRWLERSLTSEYGSVDNAAERDGRRSPFRAQNYLEKIFQIPYSLGALDRDTFGTLVQGLLPTRAEQPPGATGPAAPPNPAAPARVPVAEHAAAATTTGRTEPERIDLNEAVGTLFFEDFEEAFFRRLHGFVNTPRLAKRMLNVYRLLRARAAAEDFETFLASEASGTYRAALLLLAVNVGAPQVGGKLLYALARETGDITLDDFLGGITDIRRTGRFTDEERAVLERVRDTIREIAEDLPPEIAPYRHWAARVGSYSFDWQLVGDEALAS
jgi:hypothetical protein